MQINFHQLRKKFVELRIVSGAVNIVPLTEKHNLNIVGSYRDFLDVALQKLSGSIHN